MLKSFAILIMATTFVAGTGLALAVPTALSATVTVDTAKAGPAIDSNIYGQFSEHLGKGIYGGIWVGEGSSIPNILGYRRDVVEALKKIHVPVLRWPGGCFADQYDWSDGVGPRDKRPVRINGSWGGGLEDNAFGTSEFLNFAELIGAEPYISINMGSMTPLDAARWFEYMTSDQKSSLSEERRKNGRDKPWRVKYIGLGNEVWGCGGEMRADYAIDVTRRYASFINAPEGQPLIKVASGPTANLPGLEEFTEILMKNAKGVFGVGAFSFQALSLHYYPGPVGADGQALLSPNPATGFGEDDWINNLRGALQMEPIIKTVSTIMDRFDPERRIALAIDEWGDWHTVEAGTNASFLHQQNSMLDAEVAALTLNIFQRHTNRVRMANIAQMVNVLQAMIVTDGKKMLLTPTYHIFDMYQPFRGATPYATSVAGPRYQHSGNSVPAVDASAARGLDGKLYLALVNLDPSKPADIETNLSGEARGLILTGPAIDTHNTFEAPDTIHPVPFVGSKRNGNVMLHLPGKSVAVLAIH